MRVFYSRTSTYKQDGKRYDTSTFDKDCIFFDRGISGKVPLESRPRGKKLIELVEAGKVKCIVCPEVSRLSRSISDFSNVLDYFLSKGVALEIGKPALKTHDANGKLDTWTKGFISILSVFSEMEADFIRTRINEGIAKYIEENGKWGGRPNNTKESHKAFLEKPVNKRIANLLRKGNTIKHIVGQVTYKDRNGKVTRVSSTTVSKVKRILAGK